MWSSWLLHRLFALYWTLAASSATLAIFEIPGLGWLRQVATVLVSVLDLMLSLVGLILRLLHVSFKPFLDGIGKTLKLWILQIGNSLLSYHDGVCPCGHSLLGIQCD